jgi:phage-related protein
MKKLIFTNSRGESVALGDTFPYLIGAIEGLGAVNAVLQTQKAPYQDGVSYLDNSLEPRTLSIAVMIRAETREQVMQRRSHLLRVFSPKLFLGTLRIEYDGIIREIPAISETAPAFPDDKENTGAGWQKCLLTLFCPSPFFLDIYQESEEMVDWVGGLSFPLSLPMMFAGRSSLLYKIIHNAGDVDTPILFEFLGETTNPKVINRDTGEFIKVNRTLLQNEILIVSTEFGKKKVTLKNAVTGQETNAFGYIDLDSTFFELKPGNNLISYEADAGNAIVKIYWKNRYLGV